LSLVISLSCALLATLLLQWARRYERVAYPRYRPQKQARIRAFYKKGVEKWRIPRAVEVLPILLHISLFLFFAGLSVFLFGVHRTIFKVVTAWIGCIVVSYACLSLFPVIHKNSLYFTPLSVLFSFCLTGIRYLFFLVFFRLRSFTHIDNLVDKLHSSRHPGKVHLDDFFSRSMIKTAEEYAFKLKPDIDHESLLWTFKSLDEDAHFEEFFEGLPRLCDSDTGKELKLKEKFIEPNKEKLSNALIGLMDRTLISNLVKEYVKHRRMIIFTKAIESKSASLLNPSQILRRVLFEDWHGFLECIDFGLFVRNWTNALNDGSVTSSNDYGVTSFSNDDSVTFSNDYGVTSFSNDDRVTFSSYGGASSNDDRVTSFYAQCVATLTISIVRNRDRRWIQLATVDGQPLPRSLHHHHHEDHHSILLANAIYVVRMAVQTYSGSVVTHRNDILKASRKTLGAVCKLDVRHTLPEIRHEFCDLWNKLVRTAQTDELPHHRSVCLKMLRNIRKLYIALHDTPPTDFNTTDDWEQILDNPSFYPECTEDGHIPSSFPDLQFDAPPTRSDASTQSDVQFPEPSPTYHMPSSPTSPPDWPPSPPFPVPNPQVPATN
jgi:hypothetical protein